MAPYSSSERAEHPTCPSWKGTISCIEAALGSNREQIPSHTISTGRGDSRLLFYGLPKSMETRQ